MKLIAAPGRQFKTVSMLLIIILGSYDAVVVLWLTLAELGVVALKTALAINAVTLFLMVPIRLIAQNITATTEQKKDIVSFAAAQPMKPGNDNIQVKINQSITPSTPEGYENEKP